MWVLIIMVTFHLKQYGIHYTIKVSRLRWRKGLPKEMGFESFTNSKTDGVRQTGILFQVHGAM